MRVGRITAWQFWQGNRLGITLIALWLMILAMSRLVPREDVATFIAPAVVFPLFLVYLYLIAVLSYGTSADLFGRRSCFPAWMLTLPTSTWSLIFWPMLFGMLILAGIWGCVDLMILRRFGVSAPWWPMLLLMVGLAWSQVALWSSYPVTGMRFAVIGVLISGLVGVAIFKAPLQISDEKISFALLGVLAVAWVAAYRGLSRARSEPEPEMQWWNRITSSYNWLEIAAIRPFATAEKAQSWLEWRLVGRAMPLWCLTIALYFGLLGYFFESLIRTMLQTDALPVFSGLSLESMGTIWLLIYLLFTPPGIACAAFQSAGCFPSSKQASETSPFYACLPLSDVRYAQLKHRAVVQSTLISWTILVTLSGIWLAATGRYGALVELRQMTLGNQGIVEALLLMSGCVFVGVVLTWALFWTGRFLQLPGRKWIAVTSLLLSIVVALGLVCLVHGVRDSSDNTFSRVVLVLQVTCLSLLLLKLFLLFFTLRALWRRDWFRAFHVIGALFCWLVLALMSAVVLHKCFQGATLLWWILAMCLILPLNRLLAAPLALSWNRHR